MAELIKIKFIQGWVDENGGAWNPGMVMTCSAEIAKELVQQGIAEEYSTPAAKPAKEKTDK